ncbi:MAG: 16S rRNA (adenine(1518)-N(6)/adenine(1519)-N(6))-dimethyltransferase RsmA [Desulfovibrio sp.]|nr:16S rRNA (adenine(1518)-N(6)/adenine(1519)-N(6))-dimethyltransferase RsmA [Desulfovibrio sp.]
MHSPDKITALSPAAKKSLGQHFLCQKTICRRIAALLLPQAEDCIIEIGPGPGALTCALEAQPHRCLLLLEKDSYWAAERQRLAKQHTQSVLMDALRFPWQRITPQCTWKIVGNLPYNIASPLIWDIVSRATGWQRAIFMVQKEVGQRLVAGPGTGQYGALSVWVQSFAQPHLEFFVKPGAFLPPPKVNSAVLSFTPLSQKNQPTRPDIVAKLLRICFQQRRKQLGNIFRHPRHPGLMEALTSSGIDASLRPEALSVADFHNLANFWALQLDNTA